MTVGERIRAKRIELGITQDELARRCGYASRSSINKIELSRTLPSDKIEIVANALGVRPSYIMGWEDEKRKPSKRIATFDAMPPQLQKMISHEIITPEEKVAKTSLEHELLLKYRELNDEGQDKLLNYADDLISSNKYIKNSESEGMEESS